MDTMALADADARIERAAATVASCRTKRGDRRRGQGRADPARARGTRLQGPRPARGRARERRRRCSPARSRARSRARRCRGSSARRISSRRTSPGSRSGIRARGSSSSSPGPIFANVLVVDEVNRALPKAQSALLEGMAEHQVTVDGVTHPLPDPFLVIATENTIEQEGTFPLPEAQLDRFMVRTSLGYPSLDEELAIVDAQLHGHPLDALRPVVAPRRARGVFAAVEEVYIDPLLKRWAVELVRATRELRRVEVGASVRGSLALERMARALGARRRAGLRRRRGHRAALRARRQAPAGPRGRRADGAAIGRERARRRGPGGVPASRCPRPEPNWDAAAAPPDAVSRARASARSARAAAAVRRRPVRGAPEPAPRRRATRSPGRGPYRPRRPARRGSTGGRRRGSPRPAARTSSSSREFFADTAPRVVVVVDRRPRMGLYGRRFPWLDKAAAADAARPSRSPRSAVAERGDLAYVDQRAERAPAGCPPRPPPHGPRAPRARAASTRRSRRGRRDRSTRCLAPPLAHASLLPGRHVRLRRLGLPRRRRRPCIWRTLRALRWDVTPVIVQDPTWEQSLPRRRRLLGAGRAIPTRATVGDVWISAREARARAQENEERLRRPSSRASRRLGFDPVVRRLERRRGEIHEVFARWAVRRARLRRSSA